ncbi:MAG TPA: YigZ family protein, partial [Acidobacteriota bacterium]|nr:YigZ family protein [Acidobacteriota bacterium]
MKTISREAESAIEVKRSRFIGRSFKAATPDVALAAVKRVRETWRDATHHCWAYRIGISGEQARYDNSGEPQGTA